METASGEGLDAQDSNGLMALNFRIMGGVVVSVKPQIIPIGINSF